MRLIAAPNRRCATEVSNIYSRAASAFWLILKNTIQWKAGAQLKAAMRARTERPKFIARQNPRETPTGLPAHLELECRL
jgi:hypothetical protein